MTKRQNRLLPWMGADTEVVDLYAAPLLQLAHVTIPFAGGCSMISRLSQDDSAVKHMNASDKHHYATNLARCLADDNAREQVFALIEFMPLSEQIRYEAVEFLNAQRSEHQSKIKAGHLLPDVAAMYFMTAWMGRGGACGTKTEMGSSSVSTRWIPSGGSSAKRWDTARQSLRDWWGPIMQRVTFLNDDAFDLLPNVNDRPDCGLYLDPPWVKEGRRYAFSFDVADHQLLAADVSRFEHSTVVLRYGDDPLIRRLYADQTRWSIQEIDSRNSANNGVKELMITNVRGAK